MNFETALLIGILVGPAIYIVYSFAQSHAGSYEAYHYANRGISPADFITSTIMYAFQVAVISLFATWGFVHGLFALVVPLFWLGGYLLVAWLIASRRIDAVITGDTLGTIHELIAQGNTFRYVAVIAAFITLLGVAGPAMFEASFVADLVQSALKERGATQNYGTILFAIFLMISAVYMVFCGFAGVVGTDKIQLSIGYVGFCAVFAYLISVLGARSRTSALIICGACVVVTLAIFLLNVYSERRLAARDVNGRIATFLGAACFIVALFWVFGSGNEAAPGSGSASFLVVSVGSPFPLLSFVSLAIANGLYQLVDVGHWQRLISVRVPPDDLEKARRTLFASTVTIGFYSSLIWVLAVFFGMMLRHLLPDGDPWTIVNVLMESFGNSGTWGIVFAGVFAAALSAIMFSTLDSLIAAVSYTVHNDILLHFSKRLRSIAAARLTTIFVLIGMAYYYLKMKELTGDQFDAILYLSWSFQITLVPAVVSTFVRPSTGPVIAASLIAGCVAATGPLLSGNPAMVFELSPTLALLAATVTFVVFDRVRTGAAPRRIPTGPS